MIFNMVVIQSLKFFHIRPS